MTTLPPSLEQAIEGFVNATFNQIRLAAGLPIVVADDSRVENATPHTLKVKEEPRG